MSRSVQATRIHLLRLRLLGMVIWDDGRNRTLRAVNGSQTRQEGN